MEAVIGVSLIVLLVSGLIIVLGSIYLTVMRRRYLHRERMAAMEKGLPLPDELLVEPGSERRRPNNHTTTINGIIWGGIGIGLIISRAVLGTAPELGSDARAFLAFLGIWAYPALVVGVGLLGYAWVLRERGHN